MEVFNVDHTCARNCLTLYWLNVEPVHLLLSASGGTSKSYLLKVIYNAITKTLFYHCKDPKKDRLILPGCA